jgi:hypothetical protein
MLSATPGEQKPLITSTSCENLLQRKTSGVPPVLDLSADLSALARWASAVRPELQGFSPPLDQNACRRSYYSDEIEGRQAGLQAATPPPFCVSVHSTMVNA